METRRKTMSTEPENVPQDPVRVYLRVIDASANRACEALRVIEDFVRFVRNDPFLTETLKTLRHRMVQNVLTFSLPQRLAYRETLADVGTRISTKTEFHRASLESVLDANFSRLQEALRSLEEFSKLTRPQSAEEFEQIRYASYTVQRAVFFTFQADSPRRRTLRKLRKIEFLPEIASPGKISLSRETLSVLPMDRWTGNAEEQTGGPSPFALFSEFPEDGLCMVQELKWIDAPQCDGILLPFAIPEDIYEIRNRVGLEKLIGVCVSSTAEARSFLLTGIDLLAIVPKRSDFASPTVPESVPESVPETDPENAEKYVEGCAEKCAAQVRALTTLPVFQTDHPDFFT